MGFKLLKLSTLKKKSKNAGAILCIFLMSNSSVAQPYIVQSGDNLSSILFRLGIKPIYGAHGTLEEVCRLNKDNQNFNPNLLHAGQEIILPSFEDKTERTLASVPERLLASSAEETKLEIKPETKSETDDVKAHFSIGAGADYFRLNATDSVSGAKSVILSHLSPSISIGWTLEWNPETSFQIESSFERYSLQAPKSISFDHTTGVRSAYSFGIRQQLFDRFAGKLKFGFQDRLFFHASGLTELTIDQLMIASPSVSLRYSLFSKPTAEVGIEGEYGVLFGSSNSYYDVRSGSHFEGGVFLTRNPLHANHGVEFNLHYISDSQDNSLMSETEKKFILRLIYRFAD